MGGYDRYEHENLDEYEVDSEDLEVEDDGGDEYVEKEDDKEVMDYLEVRQKLKEQKRKELKKEYGTVNGSLREKKNLISRDSYGTFFGPSQPVIAQRVIQERKSLLESASLAARVNKSSQSGYRSTSLSASKSQSSGQKQKFTNGPQKKAEVLKNTRDYGFLFSDDAELPVHQKVLPPTRNISNPKPEARPDQFRGRNIGSSLRNSGRKDFSSREDKEGAAVVKRLQPKMGTERMSSAAIQARASTDSKKHIRATNGMLADPRKQHSSSNGSGPGRPVMRKTALSEVAVGSSLKKVMAPVSRNYAPSGRNPTTSKLQPSGSSKSFSRKEEYQAREMPKVMPKQTAPALRPKQVIQPPPKNVARYISRDERPRKKPVRRIDDDNPEDAISMIRNMFRYNPDKFANDDDVSDMEEVGFDEIMMEEKRSERIGRREDEEEFRKIEAEARRERMRKEAKKRKMNNR